MAPPRKERIAHNENAFRSLNEGLEKSIHRDRPEQDFAGFVCECGHDNCEQIVRLRLGDYEEMRQDSELFFVVPGHEIAQAEDVVRNGDGYFVVRKHVDVADITHRDNPRGATG